MRLERRLDLGGVDVHTTAHDHIRATVADVKIAVLIKMTEIADRLPFTVGLHLCADIMESGVRSAIGLEIDFADLERGALATILVEYRELAARLYLAHRSAMPEPFHAIYDGTSKILGAAVQFPDLLRAEPVDPGLLQPLRAGRGHMKDRSQRREIESLPLGYGQAPNPIHHGRHHVQPVDAVSSDQAERFDRIEPFHIDEVRARKSPRWDSPKGPLW